MLTDQELRQLEAKHGCKSPVPWAAQLPWGLDLLVQAFWHGQNRTVCEFFYKISELSGPTHEQRLCTIPFIVHIDLGSHFRSRGT